jgi:hypothetical protein
MPIKNSKMNTPNTRSQQTTPLKPIKPCKIFYYNTNTGNITPKNLQFTDEYNTQYDKYIKNLQNS